MKRKAYRIASLAAAAAMLLAQFAPGVSAENGMEPAVCQGAYTTVDGLDGDGFVSDAVWEELSWTDAPYSSDPETLSARFKIAREGNSYYLLVDVDTANTDDLKAYSPEETTAGNFWNQDCVEIFLNEDPDTVYGSAEIGAGAEAYRHIRVNAKGVISEGNYGSGILEVSENAAKVESTDDGFLYQIKLTSRLYDREELAKPGRKVGLEVFAYNSKGVWNYWAIDRAAAGSEWGSRAPSITTQYMGVAEVNAQEIIPSSSSVKRLDGSWAASNAVDLETARVDPSVWEQISWETLPYSSHSEMLTAKFKFVRVDGVYYFLIDVTTSNTDDVKAYSLEETTAGNFWNQDCVEIFLNEDPDTVYGSTQIAQNPDDYRHIRINAKGVISEGQYGSGDAKITDNYAVVTPKEDGFLYEVAVRPSNSDSGRPTETDNRIGLEVFAYNSKGAWSYWAIDRAAAGSDWGNLAPSVTTKYLGQVTVNACQLTVSKELNQGQAVPSPTAIFVEPVNLTLKEGDSQQLSVRVEPFLASRDIRFESSAPAVAEVSKDGVITAKSSGSAVITAASQGGASGCCQLEVEAVFVVPGTPDYVGQPEPVSYTPPESIQIGDNSYTLKFFDDFSGDALDPTKWDYMPEWQTKEGYYQDDAVSVKDGCLVLTQYVSKDVDEKKAEQLAKRGLPTDYYLGGAGLWSKGLFNQTYGYFEISLKVPYTQGYWAAFWLLNDNVSYDSSSDENGKLGCELDIFEAFPNLYPSIHSTNHFSAQSAVSIQRVPDFYDSYHTVSCEWNKDDYVIYIDGRRAASMKNAAEAGGKLMEICQNPLYMCITTEFGGGSKVDMEKVQWINDTYGVVDRVYVDYVRAYSLDGALDANNRVDVEGSGYESLADISSAVYYGQTRHPISPTAKEEESCPILWDIQGMEGLSVESPADHLVLTSRYVTDYHIFDSSTNQWEQSSLRAYLNSTEEGNFLEPARFTGAEVASMGVTDVKIFQKDGQLLDAGTARMYLKSHNNKINASSNANYAGVRGTAVIWSSLGNPDTRIKGSSYTEWADLWFSPGAPYRNSTGNVNHYMLNPANRTTPNGMRFVAYGNAHPDTDSGGRGAGITSATIATVPVFKLDPNDVVFASKIVQNTYGNPMLTQTVNGVYEEYNYKLTVKDPSLSLSLAGENSRDWSVQPGGSLSLRILTSENPTNRKAVYKIVDRDNWLCGYGEIPLTANEQTISIPTSGLWKNLSSSSPSYALGEGTYTVYLWEQQDYDFQSHAASEPIVLTLKVSKEEEALEEEPVIPILPLQKPDLQEVPAPTDDSGWSQDSNGNWRFRNENGQNCTGWKKLSGKWYYFQTNGVMKTGWLLDTDGKWYYLTASGAMKTGWLLDTDGKWYYLTASGAMKIGWFLDTDGNWYCFSLSGMMYCSARTPDGYNVDTSGRWIR